MDWSDVVRQFPDVVNQIDPADDLTNSAEIVEADGKEFLQVTQTGEFEGGQHLFQITDGALVADYSDTVVYPSAADRAADVVAAAGVCGASSSGDHQTVHTAAKNAVNHFSSATGPDGGNLACVWAVRHIVRNALGRWITRTDGTAVFGPELKTCFGAGMSESDVPAGGIVISPTQGNNIGHVGLLGPSTGSTSRLIYSNSSSAAMWKQNFTVQKWTDRYKTQKNLKVLFFPLPDQS